MNTGWNDMDIRWNIRAINLRRKCRVSCRPSRQTKIFIWQWHTSVRVRMGYIL